jgi:histidine triad (HIT) family protein
MNDCIFCKIIAGEIPAAIVYQDEQLIAFRDIHPAAPVHLLIVPREHVEDILGLAARVDGIDLFGAVLRALPAITASAGIDISGFRLINNCGTEGGQTIRHVHFHLIGGRMLGERLL